MPYDFYEHVQEGCNSMKAMLISFNTWDVVTQNVADVRSLPGMATHRETNAFIVNAQLSRAGQLRT